METKYLLKAFRIKQTSIFCQAERDLAEQTTQHEEGPQVGPEKEGVKPPDVELEHEKVEKILFTLLEPHWGHMVSFSVVPTL
jgi:hypothetical protein